MALTFSPLVQVVIVALAVARMTILIIEDRILDMPRGRLLARLNDDGYLAFLITCPFCIGWWLSLAWTAALIRWPAGTTLWALPWAVATIAVVAVLAANKLSGDD